MDDETLKDFMSNIQICPYDGCWNWIGPVNNDKERRPKYKGLLADVLAWNHVKPPEYHVKRIRFERNGCKSVCINPAHLMHPRPNAQSRAAFLWLEKHGKRA